MSKVKMRPLNCALVPASSECNRDTRVFAWLEKALVIYGKGKDGATPVRDKSQLLESLRKSLEEAYIFCGQKGVHLAEIESLQVGAFECAVELGAGIQSSALITRTHYLA